MQYLIITGMLILAVLIGIIAVNYRYDFDPETNETEELTDAWQTHNKHGKIEDLE